MQYVRCLDNSGYEVSLTRGQMYKTLPDTSDSISIRVIDNEGEDYLYDAKRFESLKMSGEIAEATITVHVPLYVKGILHAEALAAHKSVSGLMREWLDERLDLPEIASQ
ncbi:MAG: hypothetical protein KJZ86_14475 [Caldilineaceae bacterium]|nr:hypothetical protein [Caldilineaceae bacterium]HRJ45031.1 hypothetical protein [Caldilineaceae bacterium]